MTMMKTKKTSPRMSWKTYAMLAYVERTAAPDGTFHQTAAKIAETIQAEERSIQHALRDLVALGYLAEEVPMHRDARGWPVPASYRVQRHLAQVDSVPPPSTSDSSVISPPPSNDGGAREQIQEVASSVISPPPSNDALEALHIATGDCLSECKGTGNGDDGRALGDGRAEPQGAGEVLPEGVTRDAEGNLVMEDAQ